jgi:thioredoxin-like negative regulator of GroEL
MKRGFPLTVLPLLLAASALASPPTSPRATPVARPPVQAIAPAELDAALKAGTWLIVEFGGEHCIPCKQMQPVLRDLQVALEGKAMVHNFWIQQHPEVARQNRIMAMPTQVIFNPKGEEVFRHIGYFPPEEFQRSLHQLGIL